MVTKKDFEKSLKKMRESIFDADAREVTRILLKLVSNLMLNPGNAKFRVIKPQNKMISKMLGMYTNFLDYLFLIGFKPKQGDQIQYVLDPADENEDVVILAYQVLKGFARELNVKETDIPSVAKYGGGIAKSKATTTTNTGFDPFKAQTVTTNRKATLKGTGNAAMQRKIKALKEKRIKEMEDAGIPARGLKVYSAFRNPKKFDRAKIENENASGGGMTDQQILLAASKARMEASAKGAKFSTKAMRDLEALKKKKTYTETLLRILLPNRWVIEVHMSPLETLEDLHKLIIDEVFVSDSVTPLTEPLYFFKTPPKQVYLKKDCLKSFDDIRMTPAVLIHLGFGEVNEKGKVVRDGRTSVDIEKLVKKELIVDAALMGSTKIPQGKSTKFNAAKSRRNYLKSKDKTPSSRPKTGGFKSSGGGSFKKPKWFKP